MAENKSRQFYFLVQENHLQHEIFAYYITNFDSI